MQNDLISLINWSEKWQLKFNVSKCTTLHIGKRNPCIDYYVDLFGDESLSVTEFEKDLGVIFDRNLHFDFHINSCINRANKLLGMIRRSFEFMDVGMFISLYRSIIRPILEYANCIWSPIFKGQSVRIENVQRRATKLLPELYNTPYLERLKYLNLPSLKFRRKRGDLIQIYKIIIIHGMDNLSLSLFLNFSQNVNTRGDKYKIFVTRCHTNMRQHTLISPSVSD